MKKHGAALLLCIVYAAMCLHGIGNYWQWGHNGYNGAAFAQAARNSLRFGIVGQAQEHMGLSTPATAAIYTHHPLLLHAHLVTAQHLFGEAEWVARLTPAIYSIVTLLLLYGVVAALWNRTTALVAAFIYAVLPLNLIFANMVNHEQGSIVYLLSLLYCYVRWHERGGRGWFVGIAASFTLAAQFDWPAYYMAAFIVAHTLAPDSPRQRRYGFVIAFSAVVLVNLVAFFGWIVWTRGDLATMAAAFRVRTSPVSHYWSGLWARSLDLYGALPLALLGLWLASWRWRRPHGRDVIPWFFFGAQIMHSLLFKQAGHIHSYWTWHANPAIAIAGAEVVMYAARRAVAAGPRPAVALGLALGLAAGVWQTRFAWRQWQWGFATGSASYAYKENDDDYFHEIAWAKELGRYFDRDHTRYLIHQSVQRRRIEFMYYLDAPHVAVHRLTSDHARPGPTRQLLIADLHHVQMGPDVRTALADLARQHAVRVWNRRFIAIDVASASPSLHAYAATELRPNLLWRWFVNPTRPPRAWEPDPDSAIVAGMFAIRPEVAPSAEVGGRGGTPFEWLCPAGQMLNALQGRLARPGERVAALRPVCGGSGQPTLGPWLGAMPEDPHFVVQCGDQRLVGITGQAGALVEAVGAICDAGVDGPVRRTTARFGASAARAFSLECPAGRAAVGVAGRSGAAIDALALQCAGTEELFP